MHHKTPDFFCVLKNSVVSNNSELNVDAVTVAVNNNDVFLNCGFAFVFTQADIAPLMASLIGVPIPLNSVVSHFSKSKRCVFFFFLHQQGAIHKTILMICVTEQCFLQNRGYGTVPFGFEDSHSIRAISETSRKSPEGSF